MGERFFQKLSNRENLKKSPVFVFAADHLAGVGIHGLGQSGSSYRTHPEFVQLIRDIVKQEMVDAVLMTPADAELLASMEELAESVAFLETPRLSLSIIPERVPDCC